MRLTLRNLLAFMDDLLDPESARIIGQKTEESEFASGLLHRIRDVTRRVKLGAPKVVDRKEALDPNTVAEYLDNTLPADRVTDFEKVCLDSDVQLAEVATCHQILTLVLGEPAEVRPESRVRMYHLPETAASHTYVESDGAADQQEGRRIDAPASPPQSRKRITVPEYLRDARRRRRRVYWTAASVVVLCVAGYLAGTGQLNGLLGLTEDLSPPDQVAMNVPPRPQTPISPDTLPGQPLPQPGTVVEPLLPTPPAPIQPDEEMLAPQASLAPVATPVEPTSAAATPPEPALQLGPDNVVPVTPMPAPTAVTDGAIAAPDEQPALPPAPVPDPEQLAAGSIPAGSVDPREPMTVEPVVAEPAVQAREIGRLFTPEEMALVAGDLDEPFYRVANSNPLRTGQRVVSLPTSRPVIGIDGRLHVELVDGGELQLLPSLENGPLNIEIVSGQMILATTDQAGMVTATIRANGVVGDLSLADSKTLVAIEVGRANGPIQDPVTQPAPAVVRLWGVSGRFAWKAEGEPETSLESPVLVDLIAGPTQVEAPAEPPAWVQSDPTSTLDRRASGILNRAFDFEKPADLILRESVYHRQKEMRRLARRSLSWIEDFDPVVAVLNELERYSEWPDVIDLLCESVRRNPRTAQAVQESMATVYGARGEELYELLWKYDGKELSREDAIRLVDYLDDEVLACRVLGFRNLNRITGLGYYYRPEENDLKRRPSLLRWNGWLERLPVDSNTAQADAPTENPAANASQPATP